MSKKINILYVGDSELAYVIAVKGFDSFVSTNFADDSPILSNALERDKAITVSHMQTHEAFSQFPTDAKELAKYDVLILSDIGSNTFLLNPGFFAPFKVPLGPNRLEVIKEYIRNGGGFVMCGGYLSFSGLNAMAKYHGSPIEEVLPVEISEVDDRVEVPEGFKFDVVESSHPIMAGIPWKKDDFMLLGYNKLKLKKGATMLAKRHNDPIIAVWECGKGRTMVFASDCAPHWVGNFHQWKYNSNFWIQAVKWLSKEL